MVIPITDVIQGENDNVLDLGGVFGVWKGQGVNLIFFGKNEIKINCEMTGMYIQSGVGHLYKVLKHEDVKRDRHICFKVSRLLEECNDSS